MSVNDLGIMQLEAKLLAAEKRIQESEEACDKWANDCEDAWQRAASAEAKCATLKDTLVNHWVTAVECNHEAKTDTVRCSCSVWTGTPQPSVGAAIRQWVDHIFDMIPDEAAISLLEVVKTAREVPICFDYAWSSDLHDALVRYDAIMKSEQAK